MRALVRGRCRQGGLGVLSTPRALPPGGRGPPSTRHALSPAGRRHLRVFRALPPGHRGLSRASRALSPGGRGQLRAFRALPPGHRRQLQAFRALPPGHRGLSRASRALPPGGSGQSRVFRALSPGHRRHLRAFRALPPVGRRHLRASRALPRSRFFFAGAEAPRPVRLRIRQASGEEVDLVLHTATPNAYGHDRRSDRAAEMLLAYDFAARQNRPGSACEKRSRLQTRIAQSSTGLGERPYDPSRRD